MTDTASRGPSAAAELLVHTHIPDADGCPCQPTAGLREQHTGRHSSLLNAQAAVSIERCRTADLRRSDHITDALVSLHWLRVPERIQFKIAVLTYRVLHGNAPRYLGPLTSTVDVPGRRALRSAGTNRLVVPPVRRATVGSRAFPVAAAHTWNCLPEHIVSASTLQSFKRHLKTFLLQQSFRLAL